MEMHTVALRDGHNVTLFSPKDVLEVIDMYCGFDMRNLIRDGLRDLQNKNEELEEENKSYQNTIECNNEVEREILLSIRDECDALFDELGQPRISRRKIQRMVRTIFNTVNSEL